jgi:hypothetical protein
VQVQRSMYVAEVYVSLRGREGGKRHTGQDGNVKL